MLLINNKSLVSDKVLRVSLFVGIDYENIWSTSLTVNTVMQVVWIDCINGRRHFQGIIRLASYWISNHNPCHEHLLRSVWSVGVGIRVGSINCEIVCLAPHSSRTVPHVESFFLLVNSFRLSLTGTMIQHLHFRGLSFGSLEVFYLCLERVPNHEVLNSENF